MDQAQEQLHTTVITTLNLWQRLNAIKRAVPYIEKDEKKVDGMYNAVTHDAVTAATRDAFIEHGVLVLPTEISSVTVDSGMVTGKGNPIIRFEGKYSIEFINIDNPSEVLYVPLTAHALDQGDKAPGKALSYATKAAVLKALQIETGVNDEGREESKPKKHADIPIPMNTITPTSGAGEGLHPDRRKELDTLFSRLVDFKDADDLQGAHDAYYILVDADEMVYVWDKLKPHSKFRSDLKKLHQSIREQK